MIQIVYTNSKCSDLWEMFIGENNKYCNIPLYFISDVEIPEKKYMTYIYTNDQPYYKVWIKAINRFLGTYINNVFFIYLQEDFILYDKVNEDRIDEYTNFLKNNQEYSFVRLLKSGRLGDKKITETLYEIESSNGNIFAMQATIWRTEDFIKLYNEVKDNKWFENENYRKTMINLNMKGLYHYDGEEKRGKQHWNSNTYPNISTALIKGKWNLSEYNKELSSLLTKHNIDPNKRGIL